MVNPLPDALRRKRLPLRGADLILLGLDYESGAGRGGCNNAVLALECESPIPRPRLEAALARFVEQAPWPAARLQRPFPWGRLAWTVPKGELEPPPVTEERVLVLDEATVLRLAEDALANRIDPWREPLMRFALIGDAAGKGLLLWSWTRPLLDPHGADLLLTQLDDLDRSPDRIPWQQRPLFESPPDPRPLRVRGPIARRAQVIMKGLARVPPLSLGCPAAAAGRIRLRRELIPASGGGRNGEAAYRLAVVARAITEIWRERGLPEVPYLVPVSVDMRPKGERGPTFGNYLTFHFARMRPSEADDVPRLASSLREQMVAALREGALEAQWLGMEFAAYRRVGGLLAEMAWARNGGHPFSFNCADTGEFAPGLDSFLGARIHRALHVPAVLPKPGVGFFFTRHDGVEGVLVSWLEGVLDDTAAERLLARVVAGLGGGKGS